MSADQKDYIEVVQRVPVWSLLPESKKVTEDDILHHRYAENDRWRDAQLARHRNPHCICATKQTEFGGKFSPCAGEVVPGGYLCKKHGGPSARRTQP